MIANQPALVRRELWEHRSLYVTPAVVALVMILAILTAFVFASGYQEIVDMGIVGAQNLAGDAERRAALLALLIGNTMPFIFAGAILTTFYCLDSLYAERKSKSILFWRSLPITDAETVVSKLLTAALAIPLVAFAVIVITHLVILLMTSIFVSIEGGSSMLLVWKSAPLFDAWAAILIITLLLPVWFSPFIGWFLFVSAWTKRSPLLMAFLPLVLLPTLEYWILRTHLIFDAIKTRFEHLPIFKGIDPELFFDEELHSLLEQDISLVSLLDVSGFVTNVEVWAGLLVCGLFITAAIYVRRYRDDS